MLDGHPAYNTNRALYSIRWLVVILLYYNFRSVYFFFSPYCALLYLVLSYYSIKRRRPWRNAGQFRFIGSESQIEYGIGMFPFKCVAVPVYIPLLSRFVTFSLLFFHLFVIVRTSFRADDWRPMWVTWRLPFTFHFPYFGSAIIPSRKTTKCQMFIASLLIPLEGNRQVS